MYTSERIREALPIALVFVRAKLWLEQTKATPLTAPPNQFRTPDEAETYDKLYKEYEALYDQQGEKQRNYREMFERMNDWPEREKTNSLCQLLQGFADEPSIQVIVSHDGIDYLVFTDEDGELGYSVHV